MNSVREATVGDQGPATIPARPKTTKTRGKGPKAKAPAQAQAPKAPGVPRANRRLRPLQYMAFVPGAISTTALGLSLFHCTESVNRLTHCGAGLALAMAVTLDAGMIAAEVSEIAAHGTADFRRIRPWTVGYVVMTVLISIVLNAHGSGLRSTGMERYAAWALGAVLPTLTFVMGRLAALLWTAK